MDNKYGTDEKRITCFLPKGIGIRLVEMLHSEKILILPMCMPEEGCPP